MMLTCPKSPLCSVQGAQVDGRGFSPAAPGPCAGSPLLSASVISGEAHAQRSCSTRIGAIGGGAAVHARSLWMQCMRGRSVRGKKAQGALEAARTELHVESEHAPPPLDCLLMWFNNNGHFDKSVKLALARIIQCAVPRRDSSVGEIPTRQRSFQPVATRAGAEVTKHLKPFV